MSPSQQVKPAARAPQAERHPALDVDEHSDIAPPPGGGHAPRSARVQQEVALLTTLTTAIPVTTTIVTNVPVPNVPGAAVPTTIVQVSTSVATIVISQVVSSSSTPPSTLSLPTSSGSSSIVTPSSPSPADSSIISTPAPQTTSSSSSSSSTPQEMPMSSPPSVLADHHGTTDGAKKSSGLSGGAIAAVVIVLLIVLGGLAFFLFRWRRIKKRQMRRATWTTGLGARPLQDSSFVEKGITDMDPISPFMHMSGAPPAPATDGPPPPVPTITRKAAPVYTPDALTPPAQSYNNLPVSPARSSHLSPTTTTSSVSISGATTVVRVTFVPTLPDELLITPGETLHIRTEFDDGWAMCVNARGEQGMVPLECLDGGGGQFVGFPPSEWRSSKRASSLRSVSTRA